MTLTVKNSNGLAQPRARLGGTVSRTAAPSMCTSAAEGVGAAGVAEAAKVAGVAKANWAPEDDQPRGAESVRASKTRSCSRSGSDSAAVAAPKCLASMCCCSRASIGVPFWKGLALWYSVRGSWGAGSASRGPTPPCAVSAATAALALRRSRSASYRSSVAPTPSRRMLAVYATVCTSCSKPGASTQLTGCSSAEESASLSWAAAASQAEGDHLQLYCWLSVWIARALVEAVQVGIG